MIINEKVTQRLKANWPDVHDLNTFVECRIFDPASIAEWYVMGCNPDNEDELAAIIVRDNVELMIVSLSDLRNTLNCEGNGLEIDPHFRREKALKVWGNLQRKRRGEYGNV